MQTYKMQTWSFGFYFCLKWGVGCSTYPNIFTRKIKLNEFQILNKFFFGGGGVLLLNIYSLHQMSVSYFSILRKNKNSLFKMVIIYNIVNLMKMSDDQKKKGDSPLPVLWCLKYNYPWGTSFTWNVNMYMNVLYAWRPPAVFCLSLSLHVGYCRNLVNFASQTC